MKMKTEFKLNKAEAIDDLDLRSSAELIKLRDRLNSMVDQLNREIAKVGLEEALIEVKLNNKPNNDKGVEPNSMFMLNKIDSYVAPVNDRSIAIGMGLMARGMITKSIRVDEKGNVTAKG